MGILARVLSPKGTINAQVHFSTPASSTLKGVLAQLVERNVRNVEVRGSNPLCSTKGMGCLRGPREGDSYPGS